MTAAARLVDIKKDYVLKSETVRALRGVTFEVPAGDYVAIMGPSGSGKSTMLNLLGCLDKPTSGQFFLGDDDVAQMTDDQLAYIRASRIGFVFQSYNLIQQYTVLENIEVPLLYQGRLTAQGRRRCRDLAGMVGLGDRLSHRPTQLSGGQQQRVAIARALVTQPTILLADEPTGNLDTRTSIEVMDIFQQLNIQRGITILLITHEMDIAEYGTRLVRFRDGRIQVDQQIAKRRDAKKELAALPPPEPEDDAPANPGEHVAAEHGGAA